MKTLKVVLVVVLIVIASSVALSYVFRGGDQHSETPDDVFIPPGAEELGLVIEIEGLHVETISQDDVRSELMSALQRKVVEQGYEIVTVTGEEDARNRGLDKALFVQYTEEPAYFYELRNGLYHIPFIPTEGQPRGTKISMILQGWQSELGRGPLFALTAETVAQGLEATTKHTESQLLELRQNAMDNFWQRFPNQLPCLLFPEKVSVDEEKWSLQDMRAPDWMDFNSVAGNILLMYDPYRLTLIDLETGKEIRQFEHFRYFTVDESLMFVQTDGSFYAINSLTGETVWESSANIVVVDGDLYEPCSNRNHVCRLARLDKATGQTIWETEWENDACMGNSDVDVEATSPETVFVYSGGSYALDKETGTIRWGPEPVHIYAAFEETVLGYRAVTLDSSKFCALDAETGEELWAREDANAAFQRVEMLDDTVFEIHGGRGDEGGGGLSGSVVLPLPPTGGSSTMIVPAPTGIIVGSPDIAGWDVIDGNTGQILYRNNYGSAGVASADEIRDEFYELGKQSGTLWEKLSEWELRASDFHTGEIEWEKDTRLLGALIEADDIRDPRAGFWVDSENEVVFVLLEDGTLVAYDSTNGTELWRLDRDSFRERDRYAGGRITDFLSYSDGRVFLVVRLDQWPNEHIHEYVLHSLDARTGAVLWTNLLNCSWSEFQDPWLSYITIRGGLIVLSEGLELGGGMEFHNLHAYDMYSGVERWSFGLPLAWDRPKKGEDYSAHLLNNETICIRSAVNADRMAHPNLLLGIDVNTGQLEWHYRTEGIILDIVEADADGALFRTQRGADNDAMYDMYYVTRKE